MLTVCVAASLSASVAVQVCVVATCASVGVPVNVRVSALNVMPSGMGVKAYVNAPLPPVALSHFTIRGVFALQDLAVKVALVNAGDVSVTTIVKVCSAGPLSFLVRMMSGRVPASRLCSLVRVRS